MSDDFTVDIDELDAVTAEVQKTEQKLDEMTADLHQQIEALHSTWEGLAAQAQREAQQEWEKGMLAMRTALSELRAAAELASSNYAGASEANTSMWRSLG